MSIFSFRNEILKALKCYFSIRDEKISISFNCTSSYVLVLKCTLYLRPRFYLERAIFPIFATALERCRERMQGQDLSGGLCPLLILTRSQIGNEAGDCGEWWARDQHISEVSTEVVTL